MKHDRPGMIKTTADSITLTNFDSEGEDKKTLEEKWKVVFYECGMYFATLALLSIHDPAIAANEVLKNAVTESAIVHARNLCDFLLPKKGKPREDDIFLEDLTSGWDTNPDRDNLIAQLKKAYREDKI